jgi:D-glycero-alpha-D-manno-heptose-7-phosphate kinase
VIQSTHPVNWKKLLSSGPVTVSAPCRVDMGGTLDIRTFFYPLQHLGPCTVNIAIDMRTTVCLAPYTRGRIKVSSRGFRATEFDADSAPFRHPLGLIFAVAAFFNADGLHISVHSESPPRSALGGSSVAAAALVGAFQALMRSPDSQRPADRRLTALIAHGIEESVAGVPCGFQDQLAAVYGGVNAWRWLARPQGAVFRRESVLPRARLRELERHLLLAYVGVPHHSSDINGRWVRQFISGQHRTAWAEVVRLTHGFTEALRRRRYAEAAALMNCETEIRRRLTPDVLDRTGRKLAAAARRYGCGARFTGAGGGGCVWAIGEADAIAGLRPRWVEILATRRGAGLLSAGVAAEGLRIETDEFLRVHSTQD